MKPFVFAIISLFIVVPILCLLPIGMTIKRKLSIIAISFLISLAGLLSITLFELWKSTLILLVLVILSTVFLERQFSKESNSIKNNELNSELVSNLIGYSENDKDIQANNRQQYFQKADISLTKEENAPKNIGNEFENLLLEDEKLNNNEELLNLLTIDNHNDEVNFDSREELVSLNKEVDQQILIVEEDSIEMDEDISFLLNRDDVFNTDETNEDDLLAESYETAKEVEVSYMSEIEKLLEETDIEAEENTEYIQSEDVKEMDNLEEIIIQYDNVDTEISEEGAFNSNEEVEIEELVFQK